MSKGHSKVSSSDVQVFLPLNLHVTCLREIIMNQLMFDESEVQIATQTVSKSLLVLKICGME